MLRIEEFCNMQEFEAIMSNWSKSTGLATVAVGADGNYISDCYNFTDFCIKLTRSSKEGMERCKKCDREGKGVYFCHAGLIDFAFPITLVHNSAETLVQLEIAKEANAAKSLFLSNMSHDIRTPINGIMGMLTRANKNMDHPEAKEIPIIAQTANAFAEDIQAVKTAGMNEHVSKPIDLDSLLRVMSKYRK